MVYLSTLSAAKVSAFLHNMEAYGTSREQILKSAQINPDIFKSPDHRITSIELNRVIQETVRITKNENIGLLQGEQLSRGFSNIFGYVLLNCATLGEAAEKYCKYEKIVDGTSISEIQDTEDFRLLRCTTVDKTISNLRQFSDFRIAGILAYTKVLSGKKVNPVEVHLSYPRPADISIHERLFKCPVLFERSSDTLFFNRKDFELPVIEPNRSLMLMFEEMAQDTLIGLGVNGVYTEKITNLVLQEIKGEIPTIDMAAVKLSMSVRSLQNRLKREGTSYLRLVNEIRKEIAMNYLKEKNIPTDEIAFLLGFSESSTFHRAFKRWMHITPGEFRKNSAV